MSIAPSLGKVSRKKVALFWDFVQITPSAQFGQLLQLFLNTKNIDLSDIQNDSLSKILCGSCIQPKKQFKVIYTDIYFRSSFQNLKSYTWKESFWRSKLLEASIFMLWSQVRLYAGMPFEGFSDSAWKGLQNIRYQAWNFEIIWDIYSLRGSSTYEMFCLKTSSTCKVWYIWRIQLEKISNKWNIHIEKVFDMPDPFYHQYFVNVCSEGKLLKSHPTKSFYHNCRIFFHCQQMIKWLKEKKPQE